MASPSSIPFNCRVTRYRRRCTSNSSSPIAAPTTRGPGSGSPPLVRDLQIDYTALSLVAPEKNSFRIMLEGRDAEWQDVGTRRQAFYTDLGPGAYRFRVIASNNSGVWNEAGATLEFSIAPAYYQTRWFQALVVASALGLVWAGYRGRVRQVARQYQRRLDERVNERTRIARELHDTLLQSFHGLLLQFQTAAYLLPERPAEARAQLDGAIDHAAKAITEGRDAVQGLRASTARTQRSRDRDPDPRRRARERRERADAARHSASPSRARRGICIRSSATRSTRSRQKPCATPSGMRRPGESRSRSATTTSSSGCVCATTAGGSIRRCSPTRGSRDTTGCAACRNEPHVIGGELAVWSEVGAGTEVELRLPARTVYAKPPRRSWLSRVLASKASADAGGRPS